MRNTCQACLYFKPFFGESRGQCRRFPPVRINASESGFPTVGPDQSCGEHVRSSVAPPKAEAPKEETKPQAKKGKG